MQLNDILYHLIHLTYFPQFELIINQDVPGIILVVKVTIIYQDVAVIIYIYIYIYIYIVTLLVWQQRSLISDQILFAESIFI